MKALNVKLEDINVNMIKRYDEKVEETDEFKNLKCVISKTFRLKSLLSVKMKDNYYMLIKERNPLRVPFEPPAIKNVKE